MKWLIVIVVMSVCFGESMRTSARGLDMNHLQLQQVPTQILKNEHKDFTNLYLQGNSIRYIGRDDFPAKSVQNVVFIDLRYNHIQRLDEDAFSNMPNLTVLDLSFNDLKEVPIIKAPNLRLVQLYKNKIEKVDYESMKYYSSLEHLEINGNLITSIQSGTFADNKNLIYLDMSENPIRTIDNRGLVGPNNLMILYLKNTQLSNFPSEGIGSIQTLNLQKTPNLFKIPHPSKFRSLKEVSFSYNMFCCAFRSEIIQIDNYDNGCNETKKVTPTDSTKNKSELTKNDISTNNNIARGDDSDLWTDLFEDELQDEESLCSSASKNSKFPRQVEIGIKCSPQPDAFNPCQDVMGTNVLRGFSWIIALFAIIGNLFQLVILFHSKQKSVYKLLMYNLGLSNLLMGIYLLVLCCVDAYTYGEYYNYVQSWQYNGGCQAFGFIAVFATSLSVCSLVLITTERFLLIIFALQSKQQMHINHAKFCVVGSWCYSFIVAILPATDKVSSYSNNAICLPMDIDATLAEGYVFWLLIAYILAFFSILYCYFRMYVSIKGVQPISESQAIDTKVAKRMALILCSNFVCWLPISFAGLMTMYTGLKFDVSVAKFLIVFIFPLNACTNPFLYAIFTNVFREDTISLFYSLGFRFCKSGEDEEPKTHIKSRSKRRGNYDHGPHFLHIQPPEEEGCSFINERVREIDTEFQSPETPIKVLVDPHERRRGHTDFTSSYNKHYEEVGSKDRSDSTRGLIDEYIRRGHAPCSESVETTSTGISLRSAIEVDEVDDNFDSNSSIDKEESSILDV